ncbi:MAG: S41 family peptidase [Firmicutes bacterium]|nr:S41 family peptidase [Bacillota bacterium]MCM1401322.1 S41 family peptidase [Bacteroides sp.]MCM1477275.1 S41 family peptidase [Bacteroides sp.]
MKRIFLVIPAVIAASLMFAASNFTPQKKLNYAEQIIEGYYVDPVNTDSLVEVAIVSMLKNLDPHSSYTNAEETRELNEPLQGNFSGIGIQFNMLTDTLYVVQTISGGPSEKVGILPGDRIIYAQDTLIAGVKMKNTRVMKMLRGPKGSSVNVKVLRNGSPELIDFNIVRDDIPIYSIDASYMAAPEVGYIRISRFAESTAKEMETALKQLQKQGMKHLIIDLEDNGGGYLNAATDIADKFLKRGDLVVYTNGSHTMPSQYTTRTNGKYADGRLVVMVNQYSASASEILSGAIQDHDRGVIVGRRTFGKGLVQRPFPFPDGSMIRLTIARYYTPSGRCIQKPYTAGGDDYNADILNRYRHGELTNADSVAQLPDSLRFYTLETMRPVYGGGGIMPDRFVPIDTTRYSDYYRDLVAKGVLYKYCTQYIDTHRDALKKQYKNEDDFVKRFSVTPEMLQQLQAMGEKDGVEFNEEQFETSRPLILTNVKGLIGRDLYEQSTFYRIVNDESPTFREALKIITDKAEYNKLLGRDD